MKIKDIIKPNYTVQRLDVWLWRSRFFKTRALSASFIKTESIRLNSHSVKKPSYSIKQNDVLTFFSNQKIVVIKIKELPIKRSSARAVCTLYDEILEK